MGVTLERVQNKFACIIGELCSEPVVLSQFAIWLDLRLAEYKAKGAISLDCSGDSPDPTWMNGHRLPPPRPAGRERTPGRPSPMGGHRQSVGRLQHTPTRQSFDSSGLVDESTAGLAERLSPNILVKHEPEDGSENINLAAVREARKRTAPETISSGYNSQTDNNFSHSPSGASPSKLRRMASSSEGEETPPVGGDSTSNQSLMSIISGGLQDQQDAETVDLTDTDMNIIMDYEEKNMTPQQKALADNSFSPAIPGSSGGSQSFLTDSPSGHVTGSNTVPGIHFGMTEEQSTVHMRIEVIEAAPTSQQQKPRQPTKRPFPTTSTAQSIRSRIVDLPGKTEATIRNIANAVGVVERWLVTKYHVQKNIEEIPPEELDDYMAEFFSEVKKPSGEEYEPDSFTNLRSCIRRFLKEHGYSDSLRKSDTFSKSKEAFTKRRLELTEIARIKRKSMEEAMKSTQAITVSHLNLSKPNS